MKKIWDPIEKHSPTALADINASLLKRQIEYVRAYSSFYKKKIRFQRQRVRFGLKYLQEIPFTDKQDILNDQLENPPLGSNLCISMGKVFRIHRTSGTTTRPLLLAYSQKDIEHTIECGARSFWAAGLRPRDMVVHCLNYCMWAGGITDHQSLEQTGAAVVPYGVGNSFELIQIIKNLEPTAIHCTPSYLANLEIIIRQEFKMEPKELGISLGLFGGEAGLQNPDFRQRIEYTWGFRAMDANYGVSDVLSIFGAECEVRDGLHFMGQKVIYPELKELQSDEIIPWERGARGELILTNLCKECQPLLRFRSHDIIQVIDAGPCKCGRRSFRFRVIGRTDDMFVVKGINVFISSIAAVLNKHLDEITGEFRVIVDKRDPIQQCIFRIEKKEGSAKDGLEQRITSDLAKVLNIRPVVEIVAEASLPRTEGKIKRLERIL